jgi:hypothetical protein
MESIPKDRSVQESSICNLWKRLPAEQHKRGIDEQLRLRDEAVLDKLVKPRLSKTLEAVSENRSAVELCEIHTFIANGQEGIIGEDLTVSYRGIRPAANVVTGGEGRELEAAGWERVDVKGEVSWVNPESGYRYPRRPDIRRLRQTQQDAEQMDT